jgi:uncharacterized membrane protein HdeD (DUF308 family)
MKNINFDNPQLLGIFVILFGIFSIVLAISNAEWFFGNSLTFNLEKIQGWIRFFGRNTTRIIMVIFGIFMIVFGIFWIFASKK